MTPRHDFPPADYVERIRLHRPSYDEVMARVRADDAELNRPRITAHPSIPVWELIVMMAAAAVLGACLAVTV